MLKVNGNEVSESSRHSEALDLYRKADKGFLYQDPEGTAALEPMFVKSQSLSKAFCSGCGSLILVAELSIWYRTKREVYYVCSKQTCKEKVSA